MYELPDALNPSNPKAAVSVEFSSPNKVPSFVSLARVNDKNVILVSKSSLTEVGEYEMKLKLSSFDLNNNPITSIATVVVKKTAADKAAGKEEAAEKKGEEETPRLNDLQLVGFETVAGLTGPTFPGIDPAGVSATLKAIKNRNKELPLFIPAPELEIEYISLDGLLVMTFNQRMFAPKTINQTLYASVFDLRLRFDSNDTFVSGRFVDDPAQARLL